MGKLAKFLFRVAVLAALALSGYALFAELPAPRAPVSVTISAPEDGDG